jgi:hypothetical protein
LRVRVCAQLLTQVNEQRAQDAHKVLFAKDATEATVQDAEPSAEMERLERLLLADKILIEREARNFGTDFDVQAERGKLMAQPPAALAFALEQIRATAIQSPNRPMAGALRFCPKATRRGPNIPILPKPPVMRSLKPFPSKSKLPLPAVRRTIANR